MVDKIAYGYCHCGCGGKTKIITKNHTKKGYIKGEPYKFLPEHHAKIKNIGENNPNWKGGKSQRDSPLFIPYSTAYDRKKKAEKLGCDIKDIPKYAPRTVKSFDERLDKTSDCWVWTGPKNNYGYGRYYIRGGRIIAAHRFAWERAHGVIPDGKVVCHSCDNPACCNPAHLFVGTQMDNIRDCISKGRKLIQRGESASAAKITEEQVREIRNRFALGGVLKKDLAAEFGLKPPSISLIISRVNWSHVE